MDVSMEKFEKILWNCTLFESVDIFIVTNIRKIFNWFKNDFENVWQTAWYWDSIFIKIDWKIASVTKIPPWNNIIDYTKLVSVFKKKYYLCWYCWAIRDKIKVGDFISNISINWNNGLFRLKEMSWLIQDEKYYKKMRDDSYDICDMESQTFNKIWKEHWIDTKSFLVVSDHVFNEPFYKIDINDSRIEKWIGDMVKYFRNVI